MGRTTAFALRRAGALLNLAGSMNSSPPANPDPTQASAPSGLHSDPFTDSVRTMWEKNRNGIIVVCVAILLGILGREGWAFFSAARDRGVREEFAAAGSDAAKLEKFAAENSGHPLAGAALLLVADGKYEAGNYGAAETAYDKAAGVLKMDVLLGRAKLGAAVSKLAGGNAAGGETALKGVQADVSLPAAIRAEAAYHLASLAAEAGNKDEAIRLIDELTKLDATGPWTQRAVPLRAKLEMGAKPATPAATGDTPAFTFKPGGN